jgi:L-asparaginase
VFLQWLYFYTERQAVPSRSTKNSTLAKLARSRVTRGSTQCVVILGTGGTIAGQAATALDNLGYQAGALRVEALIEAVPALQPYALEAESVAQLDSKDMDHATWQTLARRCAHHLQRPGVGGIVVTHGTDTLEETAWFLHRVLAPDKPLVLTAAMRPATSLQADGPQNLLDAVTLARHTTARGVLVAFAGRVHGAADVQKMHSYQLDAFASPNAGALAFIEEGQIRQVRAWPGPAAAGRRYHLASETKGAEATSEGWTHAGGDIEQDQPSPPDDAIGLAAIAPHVNEWPYVALITSHSGADARSVQAVVQAGALGLVIAGTGNATVHVALNHALQVAAAQGVAVVRASRCAAGPPLAAAGGVESWPFFQGLNAAKARVELLLQLLCARLTRQSR